MFNVHSNLFPVWCLFFLMVMLIFMLSSSLSASEPRYLSSFLSLFSKYASSSSLKVTSFFVNWKIIFFVYEVLICLSSIVFEFQVLARKF